MGNTGAGTRFQIAKESSYGVLPTMTQQLNFLSESLKLTVDKKAEENLLTAVVDQASEIVALKAGGDFVVGLKPEDAGLLIKLCLGAEGTPTLKGGTTGVYKHPFTLVGASGSLPSFSATVDRKQAVKAYTGAKVASWKLEAMSGEALKLTVSIKGKAEAAGSAAALTGPSLKSFKFAGAVLTAGGTSVGSATGITIEGDNKLTDDKPNIESGLYNPEPIHETREIKVSLDMDYDAVSEAFHETNVKVGTLLALIAKFYSVSEIETGQPYELDVTIANLEVTEAPANVSGRGKIAVSVSGKAIAVGSTEPLAIDLYSAQSAAY